MLSSEQRQNLKAIFLSLIQEELEICIRSANSAHEAATHEELIAENKYDTKGLEASYLAGAQARRANELQIDIDEIKKVVLPTSNDTVEYFSLAKIESEEGELKNLLLLNRAAGYQFQWQGMEVQSITPESPIGKAIWNKAVDEEFVLTLKSNKKIYTIIEIL